MLCDECRRTIAQTGDSLTTKQQWLFIILIIVVFLIVFFGGLALTPLFTN